jgi:(p)ppGpp synthase/HD superfamily hydrolase
MNQDLFDRARLTDAFALALELHGRQLRKRSPEEERLPEARQHPQPPYIAHLMSVAAMVLEHGGTEDEAIAALLHDGPEDQGGEATLERIRQQFGPVVAEIVADCSDTFRRPKPEWLRRKRIYLDHLRGSESESLLLVSLADKVHNLRSIDADHRRLGEIVWGRFSQGMDGTLWYYSRLRRIFRRKVSERCRPLLEIYEQILDRLVDEIRLEDPEAPERWARFDADRQA